MEKNKVQSFKFQVLKAIFVVYLDPQGGRECLEEFRHRKLSFEDFTMVLRHLPFEAKPQWNLQLTLKCEDNSIVRTEWTANTFGVSDRSGLDSITTEGKLIRNEEESLLYKILKHLNSYGVGWTIDGLTGVISSLTGRFHPTMGDKTKNGWRVYLLIDQQITISGGGRDIREYKSSLIPGGIATVEGDNHFCQFRPSAEKGGSRRETASISDDLLPNL